MKKNLFLGIDKSGEYCCLLYTLASFETIKENAAELDESDFVHDATNWSGCDELERTMQIKGIEPHGRPFYLPHSLEFSGEDFDMGHRYGWSFTVCKIQAVRKKGYYHALKGIPRDF